MVPHHNDLIVEKYSIEYLVSQLHKKGRINSIEIKGHVRYFEEYFRSLKAKTIVVESHYIDKDYLMDYQAYYARCYHEYERFCRRLHFFDISFDDIEFLKTILNNNSGIQRDELKAAYLGFIVIKPLPTTVIGRTCLKTYPENNTRKYPIIRDYPVHLYGLNLNVETLAFQEQDKVAAACATSALWSAFYGTGEIFHHAIPSPAEITIEATRHNSSKSRILPNDGLTPEQMCRAIRSVGLDPLTESVENEFTLLSTAYAYVKAKIPVILIFRLIENLGKKKSLSRRKGVDSGLHAVTITGYNLGKVKNVTIDDFTYKTVSSGITKIYTHDDQVGPFARMELDHEIISYFDDGKKRTSYSLSTSWVNKNREYGYTRAVPLLLIVPLEKKIRITLAHIVHATYIFDRALSLLQNNILKQAKESNFIWDTYLRASEEYKNDVLVFSSLYSEEQKRHILLTSYPKYIWVSRCLTGDRVVFDLLFDASDFEQGHFFLTGIIFDNAIAIRIKELCSTKGIKDNFGSSSAGDIIDWFSKWEETV